MDDHLWSNSSFVMPKNIFSSLEFKVDKKKYFSKKYFWKIVIDKPEDSIYYQVTRLRTLLNSLGASSHNPKRGNFINYSGRRIVGFYNIFYNIKIVVRNCGVFRHRSENGYVKEKI